MEDYTFRVRYEERGGDEENVTYHLEVGQELETPERKGRRDYSRISRNSWDESTMEEILVQRLIRPVYFG